MEIAIFYNPAVISDDIPKITKSAQVQIRRAIEKKLTTHPELFGVPLRGTLVPFWKLRVGDYRIVYGIEKNGVYIHAVSHRRDIYTKIVPRREHA